MFTTDRRADFHGWNDSVRERVKAIVARDADHQAAIGDFGSVVTSALLEGAERAATQVTQATARECAHFVQSRADLIDGEHRRLLSEAVAASEALTGAMARLHRLENGLNEFLRAARQPQRRVAAVSDSAVRHADFAYRVERILNPPQSGATQVAARTPLQAPSYADLLG
jgi:hypothetical protein